MSGEPTLPLNESKEHLKFFDLLTRNLDGVKGAWNSLAGVTMNEYTAPILLSKAIDRCFEISIDDRRDLNYFFRKGGKFCPYGNTQMLENPSEYFPSLSRSNNEVKSEPTEA